jgi:threonine dehydratase
VFEVARTRNNIDYFGQALSRMYEYIVKTPLVKIPAFDDDTGHDVVFKLENLQITGSFKSRGVINYIQHYLDSNKVIPNKFVTYGTGNHGAALAWAGQNLKFVSHIFLSKFAEKYKMNLIAAYGGLLTICEDRKEAEQFAFEEAAKENNILVPTADNLDIIIGAGTILYEIAQQDPKEFDAVFLPIGGGSLASGSLMVKGLLNLNTKIFAGEPEAANDVAISLKSGKLFRFEKEPNTIADAAKSLGVSENIYTRIKSLDGVYEISEQEIAYWTNYFSQHSSYSCEPTSALAIASAYRWLRTQQSRKKVVIIISGDNVRSRLTELNKLDPKSFYEALI